MIINHILIINRILILALSFLTANVSFAADCPVIALDVSGAWSDGGYSYLIQGTSGIAADNQNSPSLSTLRFFEDGIEMGPAHSPHQDIRNFGQGRFSHWSLPDGTAEALRFSSSDDTDPRTNGKSYGYCLTATNTATVVPTNNTAATPTINTTVAAPTTTSTDGSAGTPFTAPPLNNPVSPEQFGAKCDGVTNDSAAFQAAVNASDVMVPANRTCVINSAVTISGSNRHIECGAGSLIKQTTTGGSIFVIQANAGERLTGASIVNCSFLGTNTSPPTTDWNNPAKHWNIPILARERVDNFLLAGNTFDRFYGQAMFQTTGVVDGGHGDQIVYNTFKNCGYYGPVFVAHANGYMAHNTMIDCAAGVENDDLGQVTGGNIIEYNTLTAIYGYGSNIMGASATLSGGCTGNITNIIDYSQNIVRNNTISGVSNSLGAYPGSPSRLYICTKWIGSYAAQNMNNSCTNGCQIIP